MLPELAQRIPLPVRRWLMTRLRITEEALHEWVPFLCLCGDPEHDEP